MYPVNILKAVCYFSLTSMAGRTSHISHVYIKLARDIYSTHASTMCMWPYGMIGPYTALSSLYLCMVEALRYAIHLLTLEFVSMIEVSKLMVDMINVHTILMTFTICVIQGCGQVFH